VPPAVCSAPTHLLLHTTHTLLTNNQCPLHPLLQMYVEENTQFQIKVLEKSGLDRDGTYLPPAIHPSIAKEPKTDMKTAMLEAEMVMGGAVGDLLEKTGAS